MKNLAFLTALSAAALLGTAFADAPKPATVTVETKVDVRNVCTFYGMSIGGANTETTDISGRTSTMKDGTVDVGQYRANTKSVGSGLAYSFRCTAGTSFTAPAETQAAPGSLLLNGGASGMGKLRIVYYVADLTKDAPKADNLNVGGGTLHEGTVYVTVPAGQFDASAGIYKGTITLTVSYN